MEKQEGRRTAACTSPLLPSSMQGLAWYLCHRPGRCAGLPPRLARWWGPGHTLPHRWYCGGWWRWWWWWSQTPTQLIGCQAFLALWRTGSQRAGGGRVQQRRAPVAAGERLGCGVVPGLAWHGPQVARLAAHPSAHTSPGRWGRAWGSAGDGVGGWGSGGGTGVPPLPLAPPCC